MVGQPEVGDEPPAELWIVYRYRRSSPPYDVIVRAKRIDCSPAPTISADGIGGVARHQAELAIGPPAGAVITPSA